MQLDVKSWLFRIRSNFWFLPILMGLAALLVANGLMEAREMFRGDVFATSRWAMSIESARLALSTIAGSMITIATLVFSMTLVALTLVSQQLGPRIMFLFMEDRETQVILGLFIATFIFALMILLRIGDEALVSRVPVMAVILTVCLALFSLGMMIRFIHHIATRIQADVLIAELGSDLNEAAQEFVDRQNNEHEAADKDELKVVEETFEREDILDLWLPRSGYLHRIQQASCCAFAADNNLILKIIARPGQFVLAGTPIMRVASSRGAGEQFDNLKKELSALITVGRRRTPEASIEFEISALVEVALRALSPGLNDPYTAIACVNRLGDGLRMLMARRSEQRVSRDAGGNIRVIHAAEPFSRYLSVAFGAVVEAGTGQKLVTERMITILAELENLADQQDQKTELRKFRSAIESRNGDE